MAKDRKIDMAAVDELLDGKSLGRHLSDGLQELATTIAKDKKSVPKKYNCHKVSLDLAPTEYNPRLVKETRDILECSQAVFARFLGVKVQTVRAWEQGINIPRDAACRLMDEIRFKPEYWRQRLKQLVRLKTARAES